MINDYIGLPYERGARGPEKYDCWGLTRTARTELFGAKLLPLCAEAAPGNFVAITEACTRVATLAKLTPIKQARPRAIATAWRGKLCIHVGLVVEADGRLWVLETEQATGVCLTGLRRFEARYARVIYYDN